MNPVFLRNYWALALRVNPVVWNTVSKFFTLYDSMIEMAKVTGFCITSALEYRYECHTRVFSREERGFVISDSFEYEEYGHWQDSNEETWRLQDERFLLNGQEVPFQEWLKSYKEKNELLAFAYRLNYASDDDSSL